VLSRRCRDFVARFHGGTAQFKRALCDRFAQDFGVQYEAAEVMAAAGAKAGYLQRHRCAHRTGERRVVAKPYWVTFPEWSPSRAVALFGSRPKTKGSGLPPALLSGALTPRARLLIINSPSNPSGLVIPPDEFERIIALAVRPRTLGDLRRVLQPVCLRASAPFLGSATTGRIDAGASWLPALCRRLTR